MINLLNDLYTCFDDVIDNFDVYKVSRYSIRPVISASFPDTGGLLIEAPFYWKGVYIEEIR